MPKFFVSPGDICGDRIKIFGSDAKHLTKVLRKVVGDDIILCDGCGTDYLTRIVTVAKDEVELSVLQQEQNLCESRLQVHIYQAVPKGSKMETVIQKGTELGAYAFHPFISERCVVKGDVESFAQKQERWQKTADEAAKQCMRGRIPQVSAVLSFEEMVRQAATHEACILPYEECRGSTLKEQFSQLDSVRDLAIIIGSEGGFAPCEVALAESLGIRIVTLGHRILRTETAAAAVLACSMYHYDEWK